MTPSPRTRTVPASRLVVAALVLVVGLAATPAAAGIRDMVKSAKDKAVQKTGQKSAGTQATPGAVPVFDDRTLELTEARVAQVLKGMNAGAAFTADLPRLVARQQALNEEIGNLNDKHGNAIEAFRQKREEHASCFDEEIEASRRQRFDDMMRQGMANPASMQKIAELTVRLNEAQVKGDTAAVRTLSKEMEAFNAITPADSLAGRKKCGAPPPPPPAFLRREAAQAELAGVDEKIREKNLKVRKVQLDASGLTDDQTAIAIDRITLYLAAVKRKETPQGFSPVELEALAANQSALASALGS